MKPIQQSANNDCIRACVASLLELPLESVPNFMDKGPEGYWGAIQEWLYPQGLYLLQIELNEHTRWNAVQHPALCVIFGELESGTSHAVVGKFEVGEFIPLWDPLPESNGLINVTSVGVILPRNPFRYHNMGAALEHILQLCEKTSNPVAKSIRKTAMIALGRRPPEEGGIVGLNGRPILG